MNNDKMLFFIGDNHGEYEKMFSIIKRHDLKDCLLIHVGDGGEGFLPKTKQLRQFAYLNKFFKNRNIIYKSIRGNHSDPEYFQQKYHLSNFILLEDYSTFCYKQKTFLLVGGAISIDRVDRRLGYTYWENEQVVFDEHRCIKADVLVSHTAPSTCKLDKLSTVCENYILRDQSLRLDLQNEQYIMDKILQHSDPAFHICGHFHKSQSIFNKTCTHRILAIDELIMVDVVDGKVVIV